MDFHTRLCFKKRIIAIVFPMEIFQNHIFILNCFETNFSKLCSTLEKQATLPQATNDAPMAASAPSQANRDITEGQREELRNRLGVLDMVS